MSFTDVQNAQAALTPPSAAGQTMPEMNFGGPFDLLCWAVKHLSGFDVRGEITDWAVGNMPMVARDEDAWRNMADAVDAMVANLQSGQASIDKTWVGNAAVAAGDHMQEWISQLQSTSADLREIANALQSMAEEAVNLANTIVQGIETAISIVASSASTLEIPIYGEYEFFKNVKKTIKLVNDIRKAISVYKNFLKFVKDQLETLYSVATATSLPTLSTVPGAPAAPRPASPVPSRPGHMVPQ